MKRAIPVASLLAALTVIGRPAIADTAVLVNTLDIPVTYQAGHVRPGQETAWTTHTIGPCERHGWSATLRESEALALSWPLWVDARRDEFGNVIGSGNAIPLRPEGGLGAFFRYGDQIWIDLSGNSPDAVCPPVAPIPQTLGGGKAGAPAAPGAKV